eukprot:c20686_g1_i1 orf=116-1177(+)
MELSGRVTPWAFLHRMEFGVVILLLHCLFLSHVFVRAVPANKTALWLTRRVNREGPYLGVVMAVQGELDPLLVPSVFTPHPYIPSIDLAGRRFHIGVVEGRKIIAVRSGQAMLNAGMTTQALLDFFEIIGIVHYGTAGCINKSLSIGSVTIPKWLAHTGVWDWERYGNGPNISLGFQGINNSGNLHFGDYDVPVGNRANLLNNVLLLPEEVYSVSGVPEVAKQVFWVAANDHFFTTATKLKGLELESCLNATTCLNVKPKLLVGLNAASASIFVDNAAYRNFLYDKYKVSSVDEESAGIALACLANNIPFIVIRGLSDLAGGSSARNEYGTFAPLASKNSLRVAQEFIKQLHS